MNRMIVVIAVSILLSATLAWAQKLPVKIVDRRDNQTEYTYVIPGYLYSQSNASADCSGGGGFANCSGSSSTAGTITPAREVSYRVRGATLTLKLPDGRLVVVNCVSKFAERFAGPAGNHRSCRVPLVDDIQAKFHGDKAKLMWPVSLNGKKKRSETYKILAILGKPKGHMPKAKH